MPSGTAGPEWSVGRAGNTGPMDLMIEARGLRKHFGEVEALAGLDLEVPSGQVLAILGPNGAGKTTLIRTIATLTRPTAGKAALRPGARGRRPAATAAERGPPLKGFVARRFLGCGRRAAESENEPSASGV